MGRGLVLCLIGLISYVGVASAQQYGFRISFTDKGGTPYTFADPSAYLSQRAIDRRNTQSIAIDSTDLPVSPDYMDTVLTQTGGKLHMTSKWFNYTILLLSDSADILNLQGKPFIENIEYIAFYPTGLHKSAQTTAPTNNNWSKYSLPLRTTGTAAYYGHPFNQHELVRGDYLHDIGWKGKGKLIAVLDEGFSDVNSAPAFDSVYNSGRIVDHYNFVDAKADVYTNGQHGTTSLSTMAGNLPGTYVGTAPEADYALYITEVAGSEQMLELDNVVAASERADSAGADVITISLGYDRFNLPTNYSLTYADIDGKTTIAARGANMATTKGILFVASAGNEGGGTWNYILTPGDADSAITIGSVGLNKSPASNSGYGPNSAGHIKPNVCMVGQPASVMRNGPNPDFSSGTSWATPQLAGWAACLMQASGNFTPYQIRTAIEKSAHFYQNPGVQLGYGVPNFQYALQLLNVKELPMFPDANEWIKISPNPVSDEATIRIYRERRGQTELAITDLNGRVVYNKTITTSTGVQTHKVSLPQLSRGVYFLKAVSDDKEATVKFVKR